MNHMPRLNRRCLRHRQRRSRLRPCAWPRYSLRRPTVVRAADGSPEVNAWVVIRPDDTVVIRIARSEMGQGTLTGLAQLVAEELECDWSKVTTEYPTPGQNVARKRAWGDFSTGGSRGIRTSKEYVRKGGATARMMLIQAAANEWKVPASECTAANSVITHTPTGRTTTYRQGRRSRREARAAGRRQAEGSEGLEARRQGRQAPRHRRQDHRQDDVRHRRQTAGHAQRRDQGLSGVRRQAEELRRSQDRRHEGRQEGGEGRRLRGRRRCRYLVARQDGARRLADRLGRRRERQGLQRVDRQVARRRFRRFAAGLCRQRERRCQGRARQRRKEGRGGLQLSLPEPRHDGAAERDRALYGGQMRGLVRHAEWRSRLRRDAWKYPACLPTNATSTS